MKIIKFPSYKDYAEICARPAIDLASLNETVEAVLHDVKTRGDEAVKDYERKFDKVDLNALEVTPQEMDEALAEISPELLEAIRLAHSNIRKFHESQRFEGSVIETCPGVHCWQKSVAIEKVGLYIPGGTAPLFSTVLMLAIPAKIAGCREIVLCTPPSSPSVQNSPSSRSSRSTRSTLSSLSSQSAHGKINPAILAAAHVAGVNRIFKIGGVQAIGAMAYGTESVPKVYKIFGPGNRFVMAAKQAVSLSDVAIDMPAGPSEVCVVADETSNPVFVAADLLSQAEHGVDSQVLLISTSEAMLNQVKAEVERQVELLPRKEMAKKTLENSRLVLVKDYVEAMALSNAYAPEHLILASENHEKLAEKVVNAGSVFLGNYACESAGDYASGTNHTLPTHGWATCYSGVNLDSYMRKITFQHLSEEGIHSIGRAVELMAAAESLDAHKNAMTVRINH